MAKFSRWIDRFSLYIALAAAWTAMLGSLYFSEVKAYVPCDLCWYQRILMYPLTLMLAIGITVRDKWIPRIVLPLSIIGMGISTYHYLLEKTDLFPKDSFCRAGASCVTVWINWFGFVTIPFLALTAFTIITIMCVVAILGGEPRQVEDDEARAAAIDAENSDDELEEELDPSMERAWPARPWTLVLAIIGVIVVIFAYLFITGSQERARAEALVTSMESALPVATISGAMSPVTGIVSSALTSTITTTGTTGVDDATIAAGQTIFAASCASCHGPAAEGVANLGPSLTANAFVAAHSDAEVMQMIKQGRELTSPEITTGLVMPPNGGAPNLTDSDLQAIIAYLRTLQ
jgi:disulfide bond formation protein DsbB/mono/diheme cytochrome c family protein